jgi:transposase
VLVALRDKGLRELSVDPELMVLRLLCDRRDELSHARAQTLNRLHRLWLESLPGGAPVKKSTAQYKAMLASVRHATRWAGPGGGWPPRSWPSWGESTPSSRR